jgi:hypothetical protein
VLPDTLDSVFQPERYTVRLVAIFDRLARLS